MLLPSGLSPHVWMAAAEHHLEDPTAHLHAETSRLVPWSSPGSTRRCLQGLSSPFNSVEGFVQVALILLANFGELRATLASTAGGETWLHAWMTWGRHRALQHPRKSQILVLRWQTRGPRFDLHGTAYSACQLLKAQGEAQRAALQLLVPLVGSQVSGGEQRRQTLPYLPPLWQCSGAGCIKSVPTGEKLAQLERIP